MEGGVQLFIRGRRSTALVLDLHLSRHQKGAAAGCVLRTFPIA
jgi:hypothetical protein